MLLKKRIVAEKIKKLAKEYPIITITGPRQSGKTTLCQMLFKDLPYVSLEDPETRSFAQNDPKGFLETIKEGAIIDEIQRVPDLLSYLQILVDQKQKNGRFIITGSQQFELNEKITQSLAGRTALIKLLPFSLSEAYKNKKNLKIEEVLYTGFYPRIFKEKLNPTQAMSFYTNTYVERDMKQLINIKNLSVFEIFLKLCAGRTGQILNIASLANECGIDSHTAKSWISILEASYIIKLLKPYYRNLNKRLVKSPKLYFLDTGLACFLLGISHPKHLLSHPLKGALFETLIVNELWKKEFNQISSDKIYYFRDKTGLEVDIIFDFVTHLEQAEIKSSKTIQNNSSRELKKLSGIGHPIHKSYLIYGGDNSYVRDNISVVGWKDIDKEFQNI